MLFKAKLNHLRISPRKVRLVTDLIKGLSVKQAEIQLKFLTKRSATPILKLLNSAVANANNNGNILKENLFVSNVTVDVGPTLKRWRARAMGRASAIMKRTSHITLTLNQKGSSIIKEGEKVKLEKTEEKTKLSEETKKEKTLLEEIGEKTEEKKDIVEKEKQNLPPKPYSATSKSKKKFFSRQTFGNAKKVFRRKSF